jgi:hypothetical protein
MNRFPTAVIVLILATAPALAQKVEERRIEVVDQTKNPGGDRLSIQPGPGSDAGRGKLIAQYLYCVADDFVVDVYHNGQRVPDSKRTILVETFGATTEKIDIEVREGDWVVFNVVNNRLRWGGASYFAVAGVKEGSGVGFTTELASGRWTACDDPDLVPRFLSDPKFLANNLARPISNPWSDGDGLMNHFADGWHGTPLWGASRNTWIRFVAR